ncbi:sigma-70 family RNA polymerase sigma factor [Fibrisoma montanum]|uniref:Sigma-70 family RNA polymerase sigma factor n=1 Tax=Fibrisoma montanum TaxID=2305895 RepID=A0A418M2L4_9BACT|nr:sigma-70 family RNA polymerase sigma factor [Fibrisoma montanum]RIV19896.1 sigma-70 family RNA polymerase sigma factor [Fibrisoma montanum]
MSVVPPTFPDDDHALWQQFRDGDTTALGQLAKKYYRTLFNYATRFTKDSALIEDSIQDVFLKLWTQREQLSDTYFVKFYLLKTLRHHLIKLHQRSQPISESLTSWLDVSEDNNAETQIIREENWHLMTSQLKTKVADLSKRQQEALYLRYYENLTYEQIAQTMGINAQSVANLLQNSLKRLREHWTYLLLFVHALFF